MHPCQWPWPYRYNETELKIYSRVNLVIDANGTPDDFTDDRVIDALFCNDCTED